MPTIDGPCTGCGTRIKRYVRPGKVLRCFECSLEAAAAQMRAAGTPGTPEHAKAVKAGEATRDAIEKGEGALYERWRGGMLEYAERLKGTKTA